MNDFEKKLYNFGVIPIAVIEDENIAVDLAKALKNGGLPCIEVAFRTDAAEKSVQKIATSLPDMAVGAGTILTIEQAQRAIRAGAKFIVSPGFDADIVDYCINIGISVFSGCITPSELMQAYKRGLNIVKFFPADIYGGLPAINSLSGPFPKMKFIPAGGINTSNLHAYIKSHKIFACSGTWMVQKNLIQEQNFAMIENLTKKTMEIVKQYRKSDD